MKISYRACPRTLRGVATLLSAVFAIFSHAQLSVTSGVSTSTLMSSLLGSGINVSNVVLNCPTNAYGTFSNGLSTNMGLSNGILLTTGSATNAIGPNGSPSAGSCNGTSLSDPQLTAIELLATQDVCILEFDLVPTCNNLQIRFVFGSEEYPEYVNGGFNDAFGFFITGPGPACQSGFYSNTNVATLPNNTTPVSIDNVNNGIANVGPCMNCAYYVNNTAGTTIQYDGFTTVLTRNVALCPCQSYHFKLAIADAGDCNYDSGVFVDFIACSSALSAVGSMTPVSGCSTCNGTASVTATGGNPGYTYTWTPNVSTTATASNLCPGTYTCVVADQGGCSVSQTVVLTIPSSGGPTSTLSNQGNVNCNGGSNGSATVSASGGTGPYTYLWAPSGGTNATATGLAAGTYTCTITDANGCTTQQVVTITQPPVLTATSSSTNVTCNNGTNGTATATPSGGSPGYTYAWAPSGGNASTATGLGAGNYTCTITDANGCTTTQSVVITQPTALTATSAGTNVSCNGGTNGTAGVTASGGTPGYTYLWAPSGGNAASASGLSAGTYTCTITDAAGCTSTQQVSVTQPTALTMGFNATNVACNGGNTGSATAVPGGGTGTYTYAWAPTGGNGQTASGLSAGTYSCTVTDANGCTFTQSIAITQPTAMAVSASSTPTNCTGNNGTATAVASGGDGNYSYNWSPAGGTSASASGLNSGNYTVTVTDGLGCTSTQSVAVTQINSMTTTQAATSVTCFGGTTGSATVSVTVGNGPYTYSWSSGGTAATESNLGAGTYTCTITDANGCTGTEIVTITQPTQVTATSVSTSISCFGGSDGSATVTASGGTPGYTYNWLPSGGTNATATGLSQGNYTCTITDASGCTVTQSVSISQPAQLTATGTSTNVTCFGANDGNAAVIASGGTPGYTYSWSPAGGSNAAATGLSNGSYTCTITDANGCTSTQSFTLTQPTQLTATTSVTSIACNGGNNGTASVNMTGGNGPYTYSWAPSGGSGSTANGLTAGSYTCTITDASGCTSTQSMVVTQPAALSTTVSGAAVCSGNPATIGATTTGGVSPYTYSWSNGVTTALQTVTITSTTNYTVTITDANGCTSSGTTAVTVSPSPNASITTNATNGYYQLTGGTGSLCFSAGTAGVSSWSWLLNGTDTSSQQSPCVTVTASNIGTYCADLVVSNSFGCFDTTNVCIEITNSYYFIPNVFTPNADGVNDVFMITSEGMKSLHCEIYDRWGVKVYEWDGPTGYWDGKTNGGDIASDGVYYYTLYMSDYADEVYNLNGFVHLLKSK
jgi:large repetitive protein